MAQLTHLARDLNARAGTRDQAWINETAERLVMRQHDILRADLARSVFWSQHYPHHAWLDTRRADVFNQLASTFDEICRIMVDSRDEDGIEVVSDSGEEVEDDEMAPATEDDEDDEVATEHAAPNPWTNTAPPPPPPPCAICLENVYTHAFLPCGHKCICVTCATGRKWKICPICRAPASIVRPIYG